MLKDTTRPLSVSPVGVCAELASTNLPDGWFTGGTYTMATPSTADFCSAVREFIPEERFILVACKGSLAKNVRDGFAGFDLYQDMRDGVSLPIVELAGFALPTSIVDPLVKAALACGSLPVVFADQDGNTFVVRYEFNMDWLTYIQVAEMSS
ncbi:hypothetical protein JJQ59_28475 [Cupriavidus necator]|uniref:Uncharacterized protein n=1 Tax=Cupriavidus necator TaxID=106590 RepID=A0A367PJ23_CUPNE|nr:hypothetical protein [Cupriavidus necator]QQX86697.1 hypothetical protein JJQ59_28475 [Cupriavidus necator]RCJ07227.1 hypothetical protein DDK22_17615 [Cupriavidus necator]